MNWTDFCDLILDNLTDDLLTKQYQRLKQSNPSIPNTTGHCYVASETAFHLLGGKKEGWTPQYIKHLGCPHWFLKHTSGVILDLTNSQFKTSVDYDKARGTGFLTKQPSKRAKTLIARISGSKEWAKIKGKAHVKKNRP
jgi:hypothetical protein